LICKKHNTAVKLPSLDDSLAVLDSRMGWGICVLQTQFLILFQIY